MTTGDAPDHQRRWIYLTAGGLLIVFALIGLFTFTEIHHDAETRAKAEQLHDNLRAAGLPAPDPAVIANALGDDARDVCQNPDSPLIRARYQAAISNGAAGPGQRPVIGSTASAQAVAQTLAVYCPDHLPDYLDHLGTLKLDDTTK